MKLIFFIIVCCCFYNLRAMDTQHKKIDLMQAQCYIQETNAENKSPQEYLLHDACYNNNKKKVQEILDNPLTKNLVHEQDNIGRTPLFYAKNADIAQLLLKNGAKAGHQDTQRWTPLINAIHYGYADVVELLLPKPQQAFCSTTLINCATNAESTGVEYLTVLTAIINLNKSSNKKIPQQTIKKLNEKAYGPHFKTFTNLMALREILKLL